MATHEQQGPTLDGPRNPTDSSVLVPRLPAEILGIIGLIAAEDNVAHSARWVARDLAVVGHEFRAAAEVVLVDIVRVTKLTLLAILAQIHRFARTRHLVIFEHCPLGLLLSEPFRFPSLVSVTGAVQDVKQLSEHTAFRPQALTLRYLRDCDAAELAALKNRLRTVARLHIRLYYYWVNIVDVVPLALTHLVINPHVDVEADVPRTIASITSLLRSISKLERLLVRTVHISRRRQLFVSALQHLAERERDSRLWLDDSFDVDAETVRDRRRHKTMNKQDIIWFTGRQLYSGSDPAASGSMQ